MDNQRLFLFVALSLVTMLLWEAWQKDYGPEPQTVATAPAVDSAPAVAPHAEDLPVAPDDVAVTARAAMDQPDTEVLVSNGRVRVLTDVLDLDLDLRGGDIRRADLPGYAVSADRPGETFRLMNDQLPNLFVAQSGLRSKDGVEPTHHVVFTASSGSYALAAGNDELRVPLTWSGPDGVTVTKTYIFRRGSYTVDVDQTVSNQSGAPWRGRAYWQLQRTQVAEYGQSSFIHTFMGGAIYSPEEKFEKIKFEDMQEHNLSRTITGGWAAMIQHYFLGAWIPSTTEAELYYTKVLPQTRYAIGMIGPTIAVSPGSSHTYSTRLYIGPQLQDRLARVAPGLDYTVDYGILTVIAKPIFKGLSWIHSVVGNWGWAIIILTILIKLAFYKLSETSYKSMANMRKLTPRMQALKERYGDDRQKLNQAMMDLYKKEKINPLGGCLPILVQIPVFISLYWVLLESVELRHAPFILWIRDMSSADPYFVLPVIMGVTMIIQQKLNPAPIDPMQAKVMMILPFVFTVFFAFFPAGLVLYWVVNNTLSIAQQWVITKRVEAGGK